MLSFYFFGFWQGLVYLRYGLWIKALARLLCPVHYTRYKELPIAFQMLGPKKNDRILDISSPKIFSVYCARCCEAEIVTTDILDAPVEEALFFKNKLDLENLLAKKEDARHLSFPDGCFDKIVSISVFEHIAPAHQGEVSAIKEVTRVLKPGGIFILTLAYAREYAEEFKKGSVYERVARQKDDNFFQRFYDEGALQNNILIPSALELVEKTYIYEKVKSIKPGSSLASFINSGRLQNMVFGPWQPWLANLFLFESSSDNDLYKPIIVCLKMKKKV